MRDISANSLTHFLSSFILATQWKCNFPVCQSVGQSVDRLFIGQLVCHSKGREVGALYSS